MRLDIFTDKWLRGTMPEAIPPSPLLNCSGLVALGSCFARNLSRWIQFHEICQQVMLWDILFNPFSIRKELERLFYAIDWRTWVIEGVSSEGVTRFRDPWRTWFVAGDPKQLEEMNGKLDSQALAYVQKSTAFLITLGLSEVWGPKGYPDIVLNHVPVGGIRLEPGAWLHRFASFNEIAGELTAIVEIVRDNLGTITPIVFTLSPVPLKFTASTLTGREADNLSKATLLVAIHAVRQRYENVYYYPSYEIVQALTERGASVWQRDGRHITASTVDFVCRTFITEWTTHKVNLKPNFWVPLVDTKGRVTGRLFVDETEKVTTH